MVDWFDFQCFTVQTEMTQIKLDYMVCAIFVNISIFRATQRNMVSK